MEFSQEFFGDKTDPQKLLDTVPSKAEIFLHRMDSLNITGNKFGIVDAVYTLATTLFTITGAALTPDEYIGGFMAVKISSILAVLIPITDNDADTVTVDPADTMKELDVSTDLVDATTYQARLFTDNRYIGSTTDKEINLNQEYKQFNDGFPEVTELEVLIRYQPEYLISLRTSGPSIRKILFKSKDLNDASTLFKHYGTGSKPRADNFFLAIASGRRDVGDKEARVIMLLTKIKPNGNCPEDAPIEEWLTYPIMVKMFADGLFPEDENVFRNMEEI